MLKTIFTNKKIVKSTKDITNGIDVNISIDNLNENQIAYLYFPKEMNSLNGFLLSQE